ncbi:hypothetical protein CMI37_18195 [Candidatus Pacearchaeota archaeon]|nr:hypothetical protein [Candidatus Pacearchaeota archaeon]|tara:strand:- start:3101 stop:3649 length:549 start_codon:yes stop_codon:yes gene_type:complete
MTAKKTNYFTELDRVDVTRNIEKKGKFSYLSWAYAVRELKKRHPEATWDVHEWDGIPFIKTECGFFVKVTVHIMDISMTQVHPVLDHQNKPLTAPNAFHINTSIQRCLAKAIALHGLGIHLYAGEDLPPSPPLDDTQQKKLLDLLNDRNTEVKLQKQVTDQISNGVINQGNFEKVMEHYTNT